MTPRACDILIPKNRKPVRFEEDKNLKYGWFSGVRESKPKPNPKPQAINLLGHKGCAIVALAPVGNHGGLRYCWKHSSLPCCSSFLKH